MVRHTVILALCLLALTPPRVCTCTHPGRVAVTADAPAELDDEHDHDGCCGDHGDDAVPMPCHHEGGPPCQGHDDDCLAVADAPPATPAESATPDGPAVIVPLFAPADLPHREPATVAAYPPGPAPPSAPIYLVCCSLRR